MDKVASLRDKHPTFLYESFDYKKEGDSLVISFLFEIPPSIKFNPKVTIENINQAVFSTLDEAIVKNFVFNLGLIEMISYWKATCSPTIEIKTGSLDRNQIVWWKNLLIEGLGEFFYRNNINFNEGNFVNIINDAKNNYQKDKNTHKDRYVVLNSGGRDSTVSLEVLKELKKEVSVLMLNPTVASIAVKNESQAKDQIVVTREIDKKLLELNANGYLNGHTPFSAYLAFLSVLCALLFDYKFVISSNERSSNEENIEFLGEKINHQYSKSFEFEKSFRVYLKENLADDIEYISLLRPLYEIQISKLFSTYNKYFKVFKSCNRGQVTDSWCGKCPKCLSTYISLYPFVNKKELSGIFNEDLYAKKDLSNLLLYITGIEKPKPFECVGTYEEILEGIRLSIKKLNEENESLPYLLGYAKENILNKQNFSANKNSHRPEILTAWDDDNFLPREIAENLKTKIKK
ncbi:hypothetical protein HYU92_02705 [Candidatus Curtissbacteria bacterium]|nr:hypothetical protein [Candidatus Curtissbacteria bacterium]